MKRIATLAVVLAALGAAPSASARVIELGSGAGPAASKCPASPCEVLSRVTGYQGRSDRMRNPFVIPRDGKIVAFTVTLSKLEQNQIGYFNNLYGAPPQVRLSILRKGERRKTRLDHRLIAQSRVYRVDRYLGSSPTFALDRPLVVRRGYLVGLTVPTWAPAFARDLTRTNWWRSSRPKPRSSRSKDTCKDVVQRAAMETLQRVSVFGCTYHTARLLYTATYIPDPRRTDVQPPARPRR